DPEIDQGSKGGEVGGDPSEVTGQEGRAHGEEEDPGEAEYEGRTHSLAADGPGNEQTERQKGSGEAGGEEDEEQDSFPQRLGKAAVEKDLGEDGADARRPRGREAGAGEENTDGEQWWKAALGADRRARRREQCHTGDADRDRPGHLEEG